MANLSNTQEQNGTGTTTDQLPLFNKVREPLALLNEHLTVVKANAHLLHMMDLPAQDVHGYSILAIRNGFLATSTLKQAIQQSIADGSSFDDIMIEKECPSQGHRILLVSGHIISTATNNQQYLLLTFDERTEQINQKREVALRDVETRHILNSLSALVAVIDHQGNILSVNDAWSQFAFENHGPEPEAFLGMNYLATCQSAVEDGVTYAQQAYEGIRSVLKGDRSKFELTYPCHSPEEKKWYIMRVTPLRMTTDKVVVAHEDVTERTKASETMQQLNERLEKHVQQRTSELESTVKELEAFSYSVSHDLRTPLRAITGFAQILQKDHAPALEQEAQRLLDIIARNADNMGHLIDDLLRFSRMSRQQMSHREIDMAQLVQEIVELYHEDPSQHAVTWQIDEMPSCYGDRSLLYHILLNLISNAVKFTQHEEEPQITIGGQIREQDVLYYVIDNGAGFNEQYQDKLFQVFQRLHSEEAYRGTGVGLSITQRIVHRHQGAIWARSKEGEGTAFYFTLPKQPLDEET